MTENFLPENIRAWNYHRTIFKRLSAESWVFKKIKDSVYIVHYFFIAGKQTMIRIYSCGTFIKITGAYKTILLRFIMYSFFYQTDLRMNFHIRNADQYSCTFFFQTFFPFKIGFLIESCP